jgi:hypothetical protein
MVLANEMGMGRRIVVAGEGIVGELGEGRLLVDGVGEGCWRSWEMEGREMELVGRTGVVEEDIADVGEEERRSAVAAVGLCSSLDSTWLLSVRS